VTSGIVIDASIVWRTVTVVEEAEVLWAPELIDIEVANVLRKSVLRGWRSAESATEELARWASNEVVRFSHAPLLRTVWALRNTITSYDAAYVALAMELGATLVTGDRRLASAAAPYCAVHVVD
jgi:predicted nucleic acid-binding protein